MLPLLLAYLAVSCKASLARQPNILFILADDLGWNDVSWNNAAMPTPHLASLARSGVRLSQAYSQQVCTPSRAALLTGLYPFHTGRQKRALKPLQPTGLDTNLTTLADQLRGLGYATHMVGKWHLGYCAAEYTPTRRGFDSFLGFYLGSQNHFSHDRDYKSVPDDPPSFYDFREGEEVAEDYRGIYSTEVFRQRTKDIIMDVADRRELNAYGNYQPFFTFLSFQATHAPLQARAEVMKRIPVSGNPARDIYKAMVMDMDMAVADIVDTLKETGLYNDTLIVFTSDNGGAISHGASNWPLRGTKGTLFEGGTRAVTFLHGPHILQRSGYVSSSLVHITDWMPTLLSAAGFPGSPSAALGLDGVDQWQALLRGDEGDRQEMVYNLKVGPMSGAIRLGKYKIIFGKRFNKQGWYDTDNTALQCARMGKVGKTKRKNKLNRRMGRKMRGGKNKKYMQTKKKSKPSKDNSHKRKEKHHKKKKVTSKKKLQMKRERERKKLQVIREKRKKQKLQKQQQKRVQKQKLKKKESDNKRKKEKRKTKLKQQKTSVKEQVKSKMKRENKQTAKTNLDSAPSFRRDVSKKRSKSNDIKRTEYFESSKSRGNLKAPSKRQLKNPEKVVNREDKKKARESVRQEQKLTKMWKDWLPMPSPSVKTLLRARMDDCNWEDFSDSGHSNLTDLMPRSDLQHGDIVELWAPILNPYHISAEDEATEFEGDEALAVEGRDMSLDRVFDSLDIALYDLEADPEERSDLRHQLPEVFSDLRRRALLHLATVVEEDFPEQDFNGHPRNHGGYFSPGWCQAK